MKEKFIEAPDYYYNRESAVKVWCTEQFGPPLRMERDTRTKKSRSNHGNWRFKNGKVSFRYEKDLIAFLLWSSGKQNFTSDSDLYLAFVRKLVEGGFTVNHIFPK